MYILGICSVSLVMVHIHIHRIHLYCTSEPSPCLVRSGAVHGPMKTTAVVKYIKLQYTTTECIQIYLHGTIYGISMTESFSMGDDIRAGDSPG